MPVRLARVLTTILQEASTMPLPTCMRLRTKGGIAHAGSITDEIIPLNLRDATRGSRFWGNWREDHHLLDQFLNLALL